MGEASRIIDGDLNLMLARERMAELARDWRSANAGRRDRARGTGRQQVRYSPAGIAPRAGFLALLRTGVGRAAIALGRAIGGPEVSGTARG